MRHHCESSLTALEALLQVPRTGKLLSGLSKSASIQLQSSPGNISTYISLITALHALLQVPGIGKLLSTRLHAAGLGTLRQLAAADPRRIEATTQRNFPFGAARASRASLIGLSNCPQ